MYKVKNPAKKLVLSLIVYALVLLLVAPLAMASNTASLSLNGQVVATSVPVENGVSYISAETLATITGIAVDQPGNIPIRQFFEARGGEVDWDGQNRQVVVLWEGNIGNETAVEEQQGAVAGRTADELVLRTTELLIEANTYRMQGNMSIDMNISGAGEVLEAQQMEMSIEGVFQYNPLAMHMVMSMDFSGLFGELTPEELAALGIDAGAMVTETVLVNGVSYTKIPGFDQWVIDDLSGTDMMEELNNLLQLTPQQSIEMMRQFGIANVLGADAVINGVEYYTVRNSIDSAAFRNIMEEMLGGLSFDAMMPFDMGLSEDEQREMQAAMEAMFETMEANISTVTYINKQTLMSERISMEMDINFTMVTPEGPVSIVMDMKGYFNLYGFGTDIQLPDVSDAITQTEWLEQLMNMME